VGSKIVVDNRNAWVYPLFMVNATAALTASIATLTTDQILAALKEIGGGQVETETRMVRAFMIEELITREGQDYGDNLMDEMGL
jgi:hypothetical protein